MNLSDEAFLVLLVLVLLLGWIILNRLIRNPTNKLEWDDLVATNGRLNAYKCAFLIGVGFGAVINVWVVYTMKHPDSSYFTSYLMFLAGGAIGTGAVRAFRPRDPDTARRDVDDPDRR
jgi:hypothetical protein